MFHDDADIRSDSIFERTLVSWGISDSEIINQCRSSSDRSCLTESVALDHRWQKKLDSLRKSLMDSLWNQPVIETAFVISYHSNDVNGEVAAGHHRKIRYHAFVSGGLPFMGSSGQLVGGLSGWKDNESDLQGSFTFRTYYGSVFERFYGELIWIDGNRFRMDLRGGLGTVLRLGNGSWIQIGITVSVLNRHSIGSEAYLKLSFATPEVH
jgi:hypothetical protein